MGGSPNLGSAWPLLMDLESDGDLEIAYPVDSDCAFRVFRSGAVDARLQVPDLDENTAATHATSGGPGGPTLQVHLDMLPPASPPAFADALQVVVWVQQGHLGPVSATSVQHGIFPWPGLNQQQQLSLDLTFDHDVGEDIHSIDVRLVEDGGAAGPLQVAPSHRYSVGSSTLVQALQDLYGGPDDVILMIHTGDGNIPTGTDPGDEVPDLDDDERVDPGGGDDVTP